MTCPSFIAAPFIVPSTATICSAVWSCRRSSACCEASSPRVTFAARVPSCLAAVLAATPPILLSRRTREVGILSSAIPGAYGGGAGAPRGRGRGNRS